MKIDILTLFPEMFAGPFGTSMLKKAQDKGICKIHIHDLRKWADDKHKTVDDRPFGGGPGMVMRVDVIDKALMDLVSDIKTSGKKEKVDSIKIILLSAKGPKYTQQKAHKLANCKHIILICGHYEDVDHRVAEYLADEEISIGDYILTGGEIPAMVIVDSVVRLLPGVLGAEEGLHEESHSQPGYIEYPQYSRPENYKGWKVPEVLISGNHAEIDKWKKTHSKSVRESIPKETK